VLCDTDVLDIVDEPFEPLLEPVELSFDEDEEAEGEPLILFLLLDLLL